MFFKATNLRLLCRVLLYSTIESSPNTTRNYFSYIYNNTPVGLAYNLRIKQQRNLLNYDCVPIIISARQYAKGKDKKKEKAKGPVQINDAQLSELLNLEQLRGNMDKSIEKMKDEFIKNLSVRSNAGSIESIIVNVDGANHTLQELGQITRKNPKLIVVNLAMFPQAVPAAVKALQKSGMNLNPQQEGTTLYIPTPKVTRDHREGLAKSAKAFFVKCKDSIRDTQSKNIKSIKSKTGVSEDLIKSVESQVVTISDGYIKQAEDILVKKQQELLGD